MYPVCKNAWSLLGCAQGVLRIKIRWSHNFENHCAGPMRHSHSESHNKEENCSMEKKDRKLESLESGSILWILLLNWRRSKALQPAQWEVRLLPSLSTRVLSLGSTWLERTDACEFSSDLHNGVCPNIEINVMAFNWRSKTNNNDNELSRAPKILNFVAVFWNLFFKD